MSLAHLIKQLKEMNGMSAEFGFFDTARYPDGTTVAQVAYDNEVGKKADKKTGEKGSPPRPFMQYGLRVGVKTVQPVMTSAMSKMAQGQLTAEQVMGRVGLHFEKEIVSSIKNGKWIPNSEETIARKGFNKPLIDTGLMWQSVASRTTKRGE